MIALRPFFMLLGRASVFWVGLFTLAWLTLLVVGISEPDSRVTPYVSPLLVATLVFPGAAGWLFGLAIQEFQHTGFAAQLPAVRRKLLSGFLLAGVVVTAITLLFVRGLEPAPFGPAAPSSSMISLSDRPQAARTSSIMLLVRRTPK